MLTGNLPFHGTNRQDTMNQILKTKLGMPENLSPEAQSLLRALFKRNPQNRLGAGPNGIEDIKRHEFFATIDWDALMAKKVRAPFIPAVARADDTFYFDSDYTSRDPRDSPSVPVSASAHEIFRGFSFVAPCLLDDENGQAIALNNNERQSSFHSYEIPNVQPHSITDEYQLKEVLGKGTFSVCRLCEHKTTKKQYAVKIIDKSRHDCREEVCMDNQIIVSLSHSIFSYLETFYIHLHVLFFFFFLLLLYFYCFIRLIYCLDMALIQILLHYIESSRILLHVLCT